MMMKYIYRIVISSLLFFGGNVLPICGQVLHNAPAPLYRDPVTDGAADPVVIWNQDKKSWWMFYTQRRANVNAADVAYCYGTRIGVAETTDHGQTWVYRGTLDLDFEPGHNTFWAPEVVLRDGEYHMFVSYIRGVRNHWGGDKHIEHYVSKNLWDWKHEGRLKLSSNSVIDADVYLLPNGLWRIWYKDEEAGSHTLMADSKNLKDWSASKVVIDGEGHEAPCVFRFRGYFWMLTDEWKGLRVYRSKDLNVWEKQGIILGEASNRPDDSPNGAHADVVVIRNRAYVFYFTHPGRRNHNETPMDVNGVVPYELRRSSIQVAPLTFKDGTLVCDHNSDFEFYLPDDQTE